MGKCSVFMLNLCRQTDGWMDGQTDRLTTVKQYAPDLSMRGITSCVCETLMPMKHPSFEKHDPDISP